MSLHLLRPFTQWRSGRSIDAAEKYVERVREAGFERFYTWTSRRIAREDELAGGSVYFVHKGYTVFRMPFIEVERDETTLWGIAMEPKLIRVEPAHVGWLRGWRYLEADKAPADIVLPGPDDARIAAEKQHEQALLDEARHAM